MTQAVNISDESTEPAIGFDDIPSALTTRWQGLADLLADLLDVPVALVMKTENQDMEVSISSDTKGNPYHPGNKEHWEGLYCQTVIRQQKKLTVVNALKDPEWAKNPDLKLGMVSYMGLPVNFPDGRPYGTLCVLDRKEHHFTDREGRVLESFRHSIEMDLQALGLQVQADRQSKELKESHALYRTLVEYAGDLIWVMNSESVFTYVSPSFRTVLGYDPGFMIDKVFQLFVHPDDIPVCEAYLQRVLRAGKSLPGPEYRVKHADDDWYWHEARVTPVFSEDASFNCFVGVSRDITARKRAQEELREQAVFIRTVMDNLPVGVAVNNMDPDALFEYMNDCFPKYYRTTRQALSSIEAFWKEVYPDPEARQRIRERVERDCASGDPERMYWPDVPITRAGEDTVYVTARNAPIPGSRHMVSLVWDVTERKRNEEHIDHLNRVLRAVRDVNQLITHEKDRETLLRRSCEILVSTRGYRSAWAASQDPYGHLQTVVHGGVDQGFEDLCKELARDIWPPCCRLASDQLHGVASLYNTGSNCTECPLSHAYPDTAALAGRLRHGRRDFGVLVVALPAGQAGSTEEQSLFRELIGDLGYALHGLETEERRHEEQTKFQSYVEHAPYGILTVDREGRFLDANPGASRITGYSREELLTLRISDLAPPGELDAAMHHFQTVVQTGYSDGQLGYVQKDGTVKQWRVLAVALDENRYLGFAEDVTERESLEAQLRQAQKMEAVGRLAGGVAHDFNNLLMAMLGYVDLARDSLPPGHPAREDLDEVTRNAQRSADLTRQLLAFARRQTVAPKLLNLSDTIASMLKLLQRLLGEDIDIAWIPARNTAPVMMDPSQVDQILANLCVNARDAIKGTGKLTIETKAVTIDAGYCEHHAEAGPGDYVMLAVSDTGCGMSPETLEKIFEPFFTTKGLGQGTGLGLPTVYGIVKQNGGFINVYSEVGQGTTFRIYIPMAKDGVADGLAGDTERPDPVGGTETLLLVEDEAAILKSLERHLRSLGYTVLACATPEEALQQASDHPGAIPLLVTDVIMPGMSGRELSDQLLALRPNMKTLFMSGYTADVVVRHGVLDKDVEFLQKPVTITALSSKIRSMLDGG